MNRLAAWVLTLSLGVQAHAADTTGSILLVKGTVSTPNRAERNYAEAVTQRLSHWLDELSLPHRVLNDEYVSRELLRDVRLVILGYNPNLPDPEFEALKRFVGGGGRLLVFYSSDPRLAELLHMRLGEYMGSSGPARWCAFRFLKGAPAGVPARVRQESRNIRPVYPAGKDARVIASWLDAFGGPLPEAAWVQSGRGLWMSHILLDDGDTASKKQMLLALIGALDASAWRATARKDVSSHWGVGRYGTFEHAFTGILRHASQAGVEARAKAVLTEAQSIRDQLPVLFREGRYADVVARAQALETLLIQAYAYVQLPREPEFRGIWDHTGTGLYPGDWDRTCQVIHDKGFTDIMANMLWVGRAHYPSRLLAASDTLRLHGDQLTPCLAAAHRRGLRVHVWKVCWTLEGASVDMIARFKGEGRLQVSDSGQSRAWLCPSHIDNLKYEKDSIRELVKTHKVDGVHLDYVRYPDSHSCFCDGCRKRFERMIGRPVSPWPEVAISGELIKTYREWRCEQITRYVRDVGALVRAVDPGIRVSAAVYGKYPSCMKSVAQDWPVWLKRGYVDFVCPMNYTSDLTRFGELVQSQISLSAAGRGIIPGLGVTAAESRLDAVQVIDQIGVLRQAGANGFVLFDLNRILETEILPVLAMGITVRPEQP